MVVLSVVFAIAVGTVVVAAQRDRDARALAAELAPKPTAAPATAATPTPDAQTRTRRVVVIGDSYTGGSDEGGRGKNGWAKLVEQQLDDSGMPTAVTVAAMGGIGYAATKDGINFTQIARRVADTESLHDADVVVVFGSRNDITYPAGGVADAARQTFATIQESLPDAKLIVIGPEWQSETPPAQLLVLRDAVAAEAVVAGAEFVDALTGQWFTRAEPDLIGRDGIHPTDAGHRKLASVIYPVIRSALEEQPQ